MKNVDVLFLYETRVRELENICLIKNELERRGITVGVSNTWNEYGKTKHPYRAKVVVTHAMDNDGLYEFVCDCCTQAPKIINMQCEQIGRLGDASNPNSRYALKGMAHQAMNICWGNRTKQRLKKLSQIDEKHIAVTGNVALDFCRKEFRGYYRTKEDLFREYGINTEKPVNLFISSFAYVDLPDEIRKDITLEHTDLFTDVSVRSFQEVIKWFDRFLSEEKDQIIIYRPHPAEAGHGLLLKMQEKYPDNFFVIKELSVKQWILAADKVFTWYSTAALEAHFCGVPCGILRPVQIPASIEVELYENAVFIESYDTFKASVQGSIIGGMNKDTLEDFIAQNSRFAFERFADAIETVLNDDSYLVHYHRKNKPTIYQNMKISIRRLVSALADRLPSGIHFLDRYRTPQKPISEYAQDLMKRNFATDEEILEIQNKLSNVLQEASK